MGTPSQSYGTSLAIWDHTVLPATRHKCTRPAYPSHVGWYSIYLPRRDGRLSWPSWLDSAPAGSRTSDLSIRSPTLNQCNHQDNRVWILHRMTICRCVENCDTHVRVETNLTLSAVCTDYCWSHVSRTLTYRWKLFIGGTSETDSFTEVPNIDNIATGKSIAVCCFACVQPARLKHEVQLLIW